jgi:Helix-turn-helix domain
MAKQLPLVVPWLKAIRDHESLTSSARLAAHTIATYTNAGGEAWPALQTIAAGMGLSILSVKNVRAAIRELEAAGLIVSSRPSRRETTHYTIVLVRATEPSLSQGATTPTQESESGLDDSRDRANPASETGRGNPTKVFESLKPEGFTAVQTKIEDMTDEDFQAWVARLQPSPFNDKLVARAKRKRAP